MTEKADVVKPVKLYKGDREWETFDAVEATNLRARGWSETKPSDGAEVKQAPAPANKSK